MKEDGELRFCVCVCNIDGGSEFACNFWATYVLLQVDVQIRESGGAVNIHMFCARRPAGLLLSTMTALDNLGLDIQQAVISCFNGFALDVFRAEVVINTF